MVRSSLAGRTVGEDSISTIAAGNREAKDRKRPVRLGHLADGLGYAAVGGAAVVIGAGYASVASMTRRTRSAFIPFFLIGVAAS